jgi:AbrB family looped-hinge helix DNA binding protein
MSKVTSKQQVTIPKAIADRYNIRPGDEIQWVEAGECIQVYPAAVRSPAPADTEERLRVFDEATERQREREARSPIAEAEDRGWRREDLYDRGRAD